MSSARSRRRPTATQSVDQQRYDRSITTFDAEGRLLPVEYGTLAAGRGEAVSCFDLDCIEPHSSNTSGRRMQGIVVCVVRNARPKPGASHQLIDKVHRIDHHAILVTSGLLGDSATLAEVARSSCLNTRMTNGEHSTLKEIADAVGSTQHQLTRTDGRRPFGVSAAVIGIDPIPNQGNDIGDGNRSSDRSDDFPLPGTPTLYRSDPGGSVDRCDYCAIGRGADKALGALESILKHCNARNDSREGEDASTDEHILADVIAKVALAALDSAGGPPSAAKEDNQVDNENSIAVDIWLVSADPKNRGGARFRIARSVDRESVEEVSEQFIQ